MIASQQTNQQWMIDALSRYGIDAQKAQQWEEELNLSIPVDDFGRKVYSNHHINLFKNIQKHVALGRTLDEIHDILTLPPASASRPVMPSLENADLLQEPLKKYASSPSSFSVGMGIAPPQADQGMAHLVERLMAEKDTMQQKLIETEKLNSHLYNANTMFHRQVQTLTEKNEELKDRLKTELSEDYRVKLLDEKSSLQQRLIESEKLHQLKDRELDKKRQEIGCLTEELVEAQERLKGKIARFDAGLFCGQWREDATLLEIPLDNFGIHIETSRKRSFKISNPPARTFGNGAMITTQYAYEENPLWQRYETLMVVYLDENHLEGQLIVDYVLDKVPVAKAIYAIQCNREGMINR